MAWFQWERTASDWCRLCTYTVAITLKPVKVRLEGKGRDRKMPRRVERSALACLLLRRSPSANLSGLRGLEEGRRSNLQRQREADEGLDREVLKTALDPLQVLGRHPERFREVFLRPAALSTHLRDPAPDILDHAVGLLGGLVLGRVGLRHPKTDRRLAGDAKPS